MRRDVGIEHDGEQRRGDVERHDGEQLPGERDLRLGEPGREHRAGVCGEAHAEGDRRGCDGDVKREVHAVQVPDVALAAVRHRLRVEAHVGLGEAEGQERQREDKGVRALEDAVVRLPHVGQ